MMRSGVRHLVGIVVTALLVSCGGSDDAQVTVPTDRPSVETNVAEPASGSTSTAATSSSTTPMTTANATGSTPVPTPGSTTATPSPTTPSPTVVQPAVWPAPDVVFDTPGEAAADFVTKVLGVTPLLGEFQQRDARNGEIAVFSPLDDHDPATIVSRGLLSLRRLGPANGWFVIDGSSEGVTISSPAHGDVVAGGPLVIEGLGRGFESNLVVHAFVAGDADAVFDTEVAMTDWATPVPYSVTLDLVGASSGVVVALIAVGDTGLETDPSEFAVIPVVIKAVR